MMPFGKYKNFKDCVSKNKDKKDPKAYCATIKRKIEKESVKYMMPLADGVNVIKEGTQEKARIHGVAISASTSRNGVEYTVEGLEKNESLVGMNVGLGHSGHPADNVGKIVKSTWDPVSKSRRYEAEIYNTARYPDAINMVEKGLWQFVSIEALPKDTEYDEDNKKLIVNDLEFIGLDFVKSPGIRQASAALAGESFGQALCEALDIKNNKEVKKMTEEKKVEDKPKVEEKTQPEVVVKTDEKVLELLETMGKNLEKLTEKVEKIEEGAEEKEEEEEVEEKSKAVIEEGTKPQLEAVSVVSESDVKKVEPGQLVFEGTGQGGVADFWIMPDYEKRRGN